MIAVVGQPVLKSSSGLYIYTICTTWIQLPTSAQCIQQGHHPPVSKPCQHECPWELTPFCTDTLKHHCTRFSPFLEKSNFSLFQASYYRIECPVILKNESPIRLKRVLINCMWNLIALSQLVLGEPMNFSANPRSHLYDRYFFLIHRVPKVHSPSTINFVSLP